MMESVSLEMDDIFGEQMQEGDEDQLPQMLPDLPEAEGMDSIIQGTQNDESENQEVLSKLKGKGAAKNAVKRSMPKLDSIRLTGERGIPILPHIFKDVKLKGKGHEVADLQVVMRYLEHWAHRLFPRMPFDEVLERIERLGTKRDVQTCIKKMRLDMPVLGSDTVARGEDEDENENTDRKQTSNAEDLFDALLREEQEVEADMNASRDSSTQRGSQMESHVTNNKSSQETPSGSGVPSAKDSAASTSTALSPSVLEKIERNRRLALERRAKKLGVPVASLLPQQGNSSPQPSTSGTCQLSTNGTSPQQTSNGVSEPTTVHPSPQPPTSSSPQPSTSSGSQNAVHEADNQQSVDEAGTSSSG